MAKKDSAPRTYDHFKHRTGWPHIHEKLWAGLPNDLPLRFDDYVEAKFSWGKVDRPPYLSPWAGIVHCPSGGHLFVQAMGRRTNDYQHTMAWRMSLPHLKGLITLSDYHARQYQGGEIEDRVVSLKHPITLDHTLWSMDAFRGSMSLVQAGEWMKNTQLLQEIAPSGFKSIILRKNTQYHLNLEEVKRAWNVMPKNGPGDIEEHEYVEDEEYDRILSSSVMVSELYEASANNIVLETIARATPHLINSHPAVMEYLGKDYPGYYKSYSDITRMLIDPSRIKAIHQYLLELRKEEWLNVDYFTNQVCEFLKSCSP